MKYNLKSRNKFNVNSINISLAQNNYGSKKYIN